MTVTLTDYDLAGLFPGVEDEPLLVVLSPDMFDVVDLSPRSAPTELLTWTGPGSRAQLAARLRGDGGRPPATALWVATDEFQPFTPEELGEGRIGAFSFYSTPPSSDRLRTVVALVGTTDYRRQVAIEHRFLELLDGSEFLSISDDRFDAVAILDHQECEHWCSQNGPLDRGMQALLPTGELSTLASRTGEFGDDDHFPLEGRIVLHGEPLTYRGDTHISWADTRVAYESMSALWDHPVVAEVVKGRIVDVAPAPDHDATGAELLAKLFASDDRYRKIHGLGFGTNERCRPMRRGNFFPDVRYPGLHFGLGLEGHSSFHFEIVCPQTTVKAHFGDREMELYEAAGLRAETVTAGSSARA